MSRTLREFEQAQREFLNPKPLSLSEAMAAANPISEILCRLIHCPYEQMTSAEQDFYTAATFLGETLNGGIDQALFNSSGNDYDKIQEFCDRYCDPKLSGLLSRVAELFPGSVVPADHDDREAMLIDILARHEDPFDQPTKVFYSLEPEFEAGLLRLLKERSDEFVFQSQIRGPGVGV